VKQSWLGIIGDRRAALAWLAGERWDKKKQARIVVIRTCVGRA